MDKQKWLDELKNVGRVRITEISIIFYFSLIGALCFLIGAAYERFIIN